jgi:hypothetical protein
MGAGAGLGETRGQCAGQGVGRPEAAGRAGLRRGIVCVHARAGMCVRVRACVCWWVCPRVGMCASVCVCVCVCVRARVCGRARVCACACVRACVCLVARADQGDAVDRRHDRLLHHLAPHLQPSAKQPTRVTRSHHLHALPRFTIVGLCLGPTWPHGLGRQQHSSSTRWAWWRQQHSSSTRWACPVLSLIMSLHVSRLVTTLRPTQPGPAK